MNIPVHPLLVLIPIKAPICETRKVLMQGFRIHYLSTLLDEADDALREALGAGCEDRMLATAEKRAGRLQYYFQISERTTWH